uniref:MHC class I-like antigen recognition-like domain-containing protein n=1 Tax=Spermophilus dauricus TaxID=99837 RepID=A0A8C9ULR5_SPEDA
MLFGGVFGSSKYRIISLANRNSLSSSFPFHILLISLFCLITLARILRAVLNRSTHSLCLDFTVKPQSRPGESWCEVQGSVDKTAFLQYDCESNKIKPLGHLGKEVNATKTWTQLTEMLRELGQELRTILLDINLEKNKRWPGVSPLTLQAKMSCQLEGNNDLGSFWNFSIDGQPSLYLNVMHMEWTVINPRARGIKEKWGNDKELTERLRKVSMGDCNHWLTGFLKYQKEMPGRELSYHDITQQSGKDVEVLFKSLMTFLWGEEQSVLWPLGGAVSVW